MPRRWSSSPGRAATSTPQRDTMRFDGQTAAAGRAAAGRGRVQREAQARKRRARAPCRREFNGERMVGQTWPLAQGHVTVLELTY